MSMDIQNIEKNVKQMKHNAHSQYKIKYMSVLIQFQNVQQIILLQSKRTLKLKIFNISKKYIQMNVTIYQYQINIQTKDLFIVQNQKMNIMKILYQWKKQLLQIKIKLYNILSKFIGLKEIRNMKMNYQNGGNMEDFTKSKQFFSLFQHLYSDQQFKFAIVQLL
ncbi:hypothetical protein IMG5_186740 [Ichthyophthirius multifiliis]|uniref:Uncharacterized protein n=1 Tax=Ichthyophthirius multifiliis TaxID=5932 RepID=G0R3N9_ICHMU|nr:hypothetical protein IMG5_186740 [Ichthyophthirius multifiliis]EGR27922.1 hypothetical protein IMG5_186740 [Ichthyophthirius multifiliis]|eukprot:XP_004027267.1 hypothetical protein IMG5_186740 [Ichthyophthirius multifiliis]